MGGRASRVLAATSS